MTRTIETLLTNIRREDKRLSQNIPGMTSQERLDARNALMDAVAILVLCRHRQEQGR